MNQEKFGKCIKEIREKNNLTQKELAAKYGVTYQAVSKWENGKNLPDIALIKQISNDFDVDLDSMLNGEIKNAKKRKKRNFLFVIIFLILIFGGIIVVATIKGDSNFEFKTLTTSCSDFTISGTIAYNTTKSSIYITNINYCGNENNEEYKLIECFLYEKNNNIKNEISSYTYNEEKSITLKEFLKQVTLTVDNYQSICKNYTEDSLYMIIKATDSNNKVTSYTIPLELMESCTN